MKDKEKAHSTTGREWRVDGQGQSPTPLTPRKKPDSHGIASWVDSTAGLDGRLTFWRRNYLFNFSTPCI